MFVAVYTKTMKPNHYTEIPATFEVQLELVKDYDSKKQISARGIKFLHPYDIEVPSILRISLKMISMTGSIDFLVKTLKSEKVDKEGLYEIHCNFYDTNAEKEDEVLEFLRSF